MYPAPTAQYLLDLTPHQAEVVHHALAALNLTFEPNQAMTAFDAARPPDGVFASPQGADAVDGLNHLVETLNGLLPRGCDRLPRCSTPFDDLPLEARYEMLRMANYDVDWSTDWKRLEPQDYHDLFLVQRWKDLAQALPWAFTRTPNEPTP